MNKFPELNELQKNIEEISNLKRDVQSMILHPNAILREENTIKLEEISKRIDHLNLLIEKDLSNLAITAKKGSESGYALKYLETNNN